jgi:hypothetical protein
MLGHGSPHAANVLLAPRNGRGRRSGRLDWLLGALCCALFAAWPAAAEDIDLRLWIAWGGGTARVWQVQIRVETESRTDAISEVEPIGLHADGPGAVSVEPNTIRVAPGTPRTYDGVTLLLTAPRTAQLAIQLTPSDQPEAGRTVRLALDQVLAETQSSTLDERGNRLLVRRTAGDRLRVRFDRASLVFAPGEKFALAVDPHLIDVEAGTALTYGVQLLRARGTERLWDEQREATVDARGDPPEVGPFSVPLPNDEGVYDILVTLNKRRLPTRFAPAKLLYQRTVQVVVIDPKPAVPAAAGWQTLAEIVPQAEEAASDPAQSKGKFWDALPKLPQWKWIAGSSTAEHPHQKPLGNGRSHKRSVAEREFLELLPGGWQAYPLPVAQVHQPHVLELEYPSGHPQTLGISILDPNSAGLILPPGLDSALDVSSVWPLNPRRIERHRVIFWPRSTTPLVLLTNRREDAAAVYSRLRVLAGPAVLPARPPAPREDARLLGVYFERPLFPENFLAGDSWDPVTGRNLNDWVSFQQGGTRLVQYLKHVGYNGALLTVVHEGSALYPSPLLHPVPKYDNGVYSATGQDPLRKDVLEMLFRLFDREGLKLVPALQFSAPLPELENAVRRDVPRGTTPAGESGTAVPGLELVNADGRSWRELHGAERTIGAWYNPLDPRVQQALRRVVGEVLDRYGKHASFDGLAIALGPQTYSQFPDGMWGCDPTTVLRFAQDERVTVPGLKAGDQGQLAAYLASEGQDRWLRWRANRLADFYRSLHKDLVAKTRGSRLYLAGAEAFASPELQRHLQPRLPERVDAERLLLRVGLDPQRYGDADGVVLLRPQRLAPVLSLEAQATNLQLNRSPAMDTAFGFISLPATGPSAVPRLRNPTGSLFYHEPQSLPLPAFDKVSPFGPEKTRTWLFPAVSPAGPDNRQRFVHSLAALDSQVMFDGSWTLPLGQQDALVDLIEVYRRLPADHFATVPSPNTDVEQSPVTIRTLTKGNRTYLYAVNDSPWPVTVALALSGRSAFTVEPLGSRSLPAPVSQGTRASWEFPLQPFDLAGVVATGPNVELADWHVNVAREVLVELRKGIDDLRKRANLLRDPPPLPVLANPGFEAPPQGPQIPGWEFSRAEGTSVRLDPQQPFAGQQALHMRSAGPKAWVRSNPIPPPKTGRLAVGARLRIDRPEDQPPLCLAIEGRLEGQTQPYYRPAGVGARVLEGEAPPSIPNTWAPYIVRFDNVPAVGLSDLRVTVDLMGRGEVWIDEVQVFDLWFDNTECNELVRYSALANYALGKGDAAQCWRILDGYWPEFLRRHVPLEVPPRLPQPDLVDTAPAPATAPGEKPKASTSWLQKIVPKPPKLPNLFR